MKLETAQTFQSRMLFRIATDPTAAARALRAVIRQHHPVQPGPDEFTRTCCAECLDGDDGTLMAYPCPTARTIALELAVPLPTEPAYGALSDG